MSDLAFRKHYIGNVGVTETTNKQAKEELRAILAEKPIDIEKLRRFALTSTLPSDYRLVVWKLLLGITPRFAESQDFVHRQRRLMFDDLFQAMKALRLGAPCAEQILELNGHGSAVIGVESQLLRGVHSPDAKNPEPEHFLFMWLMSEARLLRRPDRQLGQTENRKFILLCQRLHGVIDNPVDMFHVCSALWTTLRSNKRRIHDCIQSAVAVLRERSEVLHFHLSHIGFFSASLLEEESLGLFCEILPDSSIEKLIDKIICGSFEILTCLVVVLLTRLQTSLYGASTVQGVRSVLCQLRKEQADVILGAALENWYNGEGAAN